MEAVVIKEKSNSPRYYIIFDDETAPETEVHCYMIYNSGISEGSKGYNSSFYCEDNDSSFEVLSKSAEAHRIILEKGLRFANNLLYKYIGQLKLFRYD